MALALNSFIEKVTSKNLLVLIFLFCVTFFAYGNILIGDFVFDDNTFIEHNTHIRSLSNMETIYSSSTTAGSGLVGDNFYRPNQQFIYAIIYAMFGLSPSIFHLVVVLFHILNSFLIFILFTKLGISKRTSLFGSLLFLLHPILTEAVSYISGLSEPLVTSTILLTLLVFLESLKNIPLKKYLWLLLLGVLVFSIGLFSKENQIVTLGLIFIVFIFQYKKGQILNLFRPIVFIGILSIISALYVYFRLTMLNFTGVLGLTSEVNSYTQNLSVRLLTFIHILPEYFKMIIFPWHLYYEKPYAAYDSALGFQSIISIIFLLAGFASVIISVFKRNAKALLDISFGFMWFLIALLPVSGIIPVNSMYLEHWLYVPIIGVIFCLCALWENLGAKLPFGSLAPKFSVCLFIIILILFSVRIMIRNTEWGDPVKFYENELRYTDSSARIYNDLAMEKADLGDCEAAIPLYEKAISLNDSYPQTHHNLARCFVTLGKIDEALVEYKKALQIQPNFIYTLRDLYDLGFTVSNN